MRVDPNVVEAAKAVSERHRLPAAVLLAIAIVETNAVSGTHVGTVVEPLIRFEGHYFDRLLLGDARRIARTAGLSHPKAGAVRNPSGQVARWALLNRAASIDPAAAYRSTSWGLCQVMGDHFARLGFAAPEDLAAEARRSPDGQFEIAARFLAIGRLGAILASGDHAGFARRYNGPNYRQNSYDTKIAAAMRDAERVLGLSTLPKRGDRGPAVAALQRALAKAGHATAADGIFGSLTAAALAAFQRVAGQGADPRNTVS